MPRKYLVHLLNFPFFTFALLISLSKLKRFKEKNSVRLRNDITLLLRWNEQQYGRKWPHFDNYRARLEHLTGRRCHFLLSFRWRWTNFPWWAYWRNVSARGRNTSPCSRPLIQLCLLHSHLIGTALSGNWLDDIAHVDNWHCVTLSHCHSQPKHHNILEESRVGLRPRPITEITNCLSPSIILLSCWRVIRGADCPPCWLWGLCWPLPGELSPAWP